MLKKLTLQNWKSFKYAELNLEEITVLIGTNASGKTNLIESFDFLQKITISTDLQTALSHVRGGIDWVNYQGKSQFTIEILLEGEDNFTDYIYSITVETQPSVRNLNESLLEIKYQDNKEEQQYLFKTASDSEHNHSIYVEIYGKNKKHFFRNSHTILPSLIGYPTDNFIPGLQEVKKTIESIFIFDPIPDQMRGYSPINPIYLEKNAANFAGFLANLPAEYQEKINFYSKNLAMGEITKFWAEPVGILLKDAMIYCEEKCGDLSEKRIIDARTMSNGTLRFIAILTALLTLPEKTTLIMEEVDNYLHPSRSELLVKVIKELSKLRKIDVLLTTHNPSLLDAFDVEIIPFVTVVYRNFHTGESQLTLLENLDDLPKLMSWGKLGKIMTTGAIENSLMAG
jgi:predicted ATPase